VVLPQDYDLLVERLLAAGRAAHHKALEGWQGPHRCVRLRVCRMCRQHARAHGQCHSPRVLGARLQSMLPRRAQV
jgi:hypothetical protein